MLTTGAKCHSVGLINFILSLGAKKPPRVKDFIQGPGLRRKQETARPLFPFLCFPNANAVFWVFKRTLKTPLFVSAFVHPVLLKDRAVVTMAVSRGW